MQEFVWTQLEHEKRLVRLQGDQEASKTSEQLPMFCMQKAFAGLYWSCLAYDSHEVRRFSLSAGRNDSEDI